MVAHIERQTRIAKAAEVVKAKARALAVAGKNMTAMRYAAAADALHYLAGGDMTGKRLAASEARFYFRAGRKTT